MKVYSNFDEIDKDLKIFKLKREIHKTELQLGVQRAKQDVSSSFSPVSIISSMFGSIIQKAIVAKIVSTLFGYKKVKEED